MRYITAVLMCLMLTACGKTGALYLPEEAPDQPPQTEPAPTPDADTGGNVDSSGREED